MRNSSWIAIFLDMITMTSQWWFLRIIVIHSFIWIPHDSNKVTHHNDVMLLSLRVTLCDPWFQARRATFLWRAKKNSHQSYLFGAPGAWQCLDWIKSCSSTHRSFWGYSYFLPKKHVGYRLVHLVVIQDVHLDHMLECRASRSDSCARYLGSSPVDRAVYLGSTVFFACERGNSLQ